MIHHIYFSENIFDKIFRLEMLCMKLTVKTFCKIPKKKKNIL